MINIELKVVDNPLHQKIEKIKLYRLCSMIKINIEEFTNDYYNSNCLFTSFPNKFRYNIFKKSVSLILDKYNISYKFDYIYDKNSDEVKIFIGKNFVLNLNFILENEYHI